MGFLEVGTPLSWEESESVRSYVKRHGLLQFLNVWNKNKNRFDDSLRWGEEVEYSLVDIDSEQGHSRIYVDAAEIISELEVREHICSRTPAQLSSDWHPEFANHMVEAIPSPPYPLNTHSLLMIEPSMRLRRAKIQSILPSQKFVTSQTAFPRFGLGDFMTPVQGSGVDPDHSITRSIFIPDELINPHPRFGTLVNNIRCRRGAKPVITIPVYQDSKTFKPNPEGGVEADWSLSRAASDIDRFEVEKLARQTVNPIKGQIYMDCFAFGMGMSCVQTTFATPDISTARYLYDQLSVLGPLFLALTASTPVLRGLLADTDTRWSTLEQAVDCRTEEEMKTIPKSRYSGVSIYISDRPRLTEHLAELNDSNAPINEEAKTMLMEAGVDEILATHYGHLWVRDPMVIFGEKVELDDSQAVDHFENIQSTNWNSIRFKPPPPAPASESNPEALSPIGWRVEFRTPEIQLTDFDNAAGVALISVIAQMILSHQLDLYIPMSKNDINMHRSWNRDAVTEEKFWFRTNISHGTTDWSISEMTLHEILTGCPRVGFKGLVPMCEEFLASETAAGRCGNDARLRFGQYCNLLTQRTSGQLLTGAQLLRKFVLAHPDYKHDSIVTPTISHDLTVLSANIGFGAWTSPDLHGDLISALIPQTPLPPSTVLPEFSSMLMHDESIVAFKGESISRSSQPSSSSPQFFLSRRKMVELNQIESIYASSSSKESNLFDLTFGELMDHQNVSTTMKSIPSTPMLNNSGNKASASRDEQLQRRALWCLKGFDLVGHGPVEKQALVKSRLVQLKKSACPVCCGCRNESPATTTTSASSQGLLVAGSLSSKSSSSLVTDSSSPNTAVVAPLNSMSTSDELKCTCNSSQSLQELLFMQLKKKGVAPSSADEFEFDILGSTVCPSTACCDCEIGDQLIHELSRSLEDTEEEYFKQVVCESSA